MGSDDELGGLGVGGIVKFPWKWEFFLSWAVRLIGNVSFRAIGGVHIMASETFEVGMVIVPSDAVSVTDPGSLCDGGYRSM